MVAMNQPPQQPSDYDHAKVMRAFDEVADVVRGVCTGGWTAEEQLQLLTHVALFATNLLIRMRQKGEALDASSTDT